MYLMLNMHFHSEPSKSELLQQSNAKMIVKLAHESPKSFGLGGTGAASRHCRGGPSGRPLPRGPLREATATLAPLYASNFHFSFVWPCAALSYSAKVLSNQHIPFHHLSVHGHCNMASLTDKRRCPAPWARATPLDQLARGSKTPFPTARAAVNCISRLRALITSRRLPPLTPNLSLSAAEEAGLQQGDHFFALKPGQNLKVIEFMILESPVFSTDSTADPPYDVRSCAVSVAGIHALPALAAMPAVRTPVIIVGGDGSEISLSTTAAMPLILYGPLALALELVDASAQLAIFCDAHPPRPALPGRSSQVSRLVHPYYSALARVRCVWVFTDMQLTELQEVARALNIFGSIKAINSMKKEGAPDSGRRYYGIYFDDTDAAHVGLAALKGVFDVSKPLSPILLLASDAQLGHYLSEPLGPSCLELMSSTRLPFVQEPTILLHNFALTDQVCAMLAQSAASWPACYQFKGASVCWQLVSL
jgi:hypothetical protein